ncbi:MAG: 2-oxoacid:ferredoxin oxidoreductase subunit alpha [Candidatus Micrarchaeaceae archaeon]
MRISWMSGGPQGSGIDTSANIFSKAVAKAGYSIYGNREYYSNIKGRHSYFNLTISDSPARSIDGRIDILATFDAETAFQHFHEVRSIFLYDIKQESISVESIRSIEPDITNEVLETLKEEGGSTIKEVISYLKKRGVNTIGIDYESIIMKVINETGASPVIADRARNVVCIAASFALLGLDKNFLASAIRDVFKSEQYLKINTLAAELGIASAQSSYSLKPISRQEKTAILDGNTISALGKLAGGLRFQSYYPITPAADESTYIEANQVIGLSGNRGRGGVVVLQTEDELAAINSAVGAALTGARAATATSGPGFSLMAEGISWAGMNEVPVTITYYMRGAPATGLPTRSGQADLKFALNVGHGEFPRLVIASGSGREVFYDAIYALNLAERYQTPVIHIIEKTLANSYISIPLSELNGKAGIDRGRLAPDAGEQYKRFEFSNDGISPRAFLGKARMFYTGDEHNEFGHITENSANRTNMYSKRMKKLETADAEIPQEVRANFFGEKDADTILLTWGATTGAALDALEELEGKGIRAGILQVRMFNPYPAKLVESLLKGKRMIIDVESNYGAQAATVLTEKTGIKPTGYILKWNGRAIARDELYEAVVQIHEGKVNKVVLNGGR